MIDIPTAVMIDIPTAVIIDISAETQTRTAALLQLYSILRHIGASRA